MEFNFMDRNYKTKVWSKSDGVIGDIFAFDTETSMAVDSEVPYFVLGQAYAEGPLVYLITLKNLKCFYETHRESTWVMHNAPFDIAVVEKEIGADYDELIRSKRIFDIGILYRLLELAKTGQVPRKWKLAVIAKALLNIDLKKDENVRTNFGRYRVMIPKYLIKSIGIGKQVKGF